MIHYLLKITTYFYDPQGNPDFGGRSFSITNDELYPKIKPGINYEIDWSVENFVEYGNIEHHGEDGYNCKVKIYSFKIIKEDEIPPIRKMLFNYKLLNEDY